MYTIYIVCILEVNTSSMHQLESGVYAIRIRLGGMRSQHVIHLVLDIPDAFSDIDESPSATRSNHKHIFTL